MKEHYGSLEWFWNHPQYLKWLASTTSSLLYIEGKPGSGKSTLAKYFEKNLLEREPIASSSTVAHYFYTFRGTQLEATHENMLRSILYSILQQDESTFFHFQLEFRNFRRCNLLEWPDDSLKTVLSCFANHPPTKPLYIILDAMDESKEEDRYDVIQLLCRLCTAKTSCVKVFLASHPVAELKHQIEESHYIIKLQNENKDDIKKFVDDFLPNLELRSPFLREAADYINANAEGVFVWVHLVKAELLRMRATCHNDTQIMDRLKHLPTELVNFYKLMLERLEEESSTQDIQHGITLFQLVLFGLRPLTVGEVQHVLAIPSDSERSLQGFKENLIDEIERRIVHCGGNFVEITGTLFDREITNTQLVTSVADNTVQLMHQTTREFLLQIRQEKPKFALSDEEAHIAIATASVRYLTLCFTNAEPTMRDALPEVKNWCPEDFLQYVRYLDEWLWINYALPHFKTHYTLCGQNKSVSQLVHAIIKRLTENQRTEFLGNWMARHVGQTKFTGDFVRSMTSLIPLRHIDSRVSPDDFKYKVLDAAAALKLLRVVESLLPSCKQVDARARRETPLILCARTGLEDASQVLVDSNEDLNAKNIVGRTALHYAAKNGHEAIVKLLLKQGANKMVKDYFRLIAMQLAVKKL